MPNFDIVRIRVVIIGERLKDLFAILYDGVVSLFTIQPFIHFLHLGIRCV